MAFLSRLACQPKRETRPAFVHFAVSLQVLRGHYGLALLCAADIAADAGVGRNVVHKRSCGVHSLRLVVARHFRREQFRPHVGKSTV